MNKSAMLTFVALLILFGFESHSHSIGYYFANLVRSAEYIGEARFSDELLLEYNNSFCGYSYKVDSINILKGDSPKKVWSTEKIEVNKRYMVMLLDSSTQYEELVGHTLFYKNSTGLKKIIDGCLDLVPDLTIGNNKSGLFPIAEINADHIITTEHIFLISDSELSLSDTGEECFTALKSEQKAQLDCFKDLVKEIVHKQK